MAKKKATTTAQADKSKARISKAQLQREAKRLKIVGYTRMSMEALQEAVLAVLLAPAKKKTAKAKAKKKAVKKKPVYKSALTKKDVLELIESGEILEFSEMNFSGYTQIDDDAAKCIAEEGGGSICFWNTPYLTISDEAAVWLVQCGNSSSILFGPEEKLEMSDEAARIFADNIKKLEILGYGKASCSHPRRRRPTVETEFWSFEKCSKNVAKILLSAG